MAKPTDDWNVLPHEPIQKLSENLWRVVGSLRGISLRRVMTLARMQDGRLLFHSPIALAPESMAEIEAWGTPSFLLVPNAYHRLDAPAYKKRYPELRVFAPRGSRTKIESVLKVDATYEDFPSDERVRVYTLPGVADAEGALIVHSADGVTVVLNDVVFNMDPKPDLLGFLFSTALGSAPGPRVSRVAKLMLIKDRKAVRAELERLAATPDLARLVVSHDKVASGPAAREALLQAATFL